MWAILPLKQIDKAKQRLSPFLSAIERRIFFRAMAEDLLTVLSQHPLLENTLVISSDQQIRQMAADFGVNYLRESENSSGDLNAAVTEGFAELSRRGIGSAMVVHGDIPLLSAADINQLLSNHNRLDPQLVTIVPDQDKQGSNCLVTAVNTPLTFCYGKNSFYLHAQQAKEKNLKLQVELLPSAAIDIDTPADFHSLLERINPLTSPNTYNFLIRSDIEARLRLHGCG